MYVPAQNTVADNYNAIGFFDMQKDNYRIFPKSRFRIKGADIDSGFVGDDAGRSQGVSPNISPMEFSRVM